MAVNSLRLALAWLERRAAKAAIPRSWAEVQRAELYDLPAGTTLQSKSRKKNKVKLSSPLLRWNQAMKIVSRNKHHKIFQMCLGGNLHLIALHRDQQACYFCYYFPG